MIFLYLLSKRTYVEYFDLFKNGRHFEVSRSIEPKVVPEIES